MKFGTLLFSSLYLILSWVRISIPTKFVSYKYLNKKIGATLALYPTKRLDMCYILLKWDHLDHYYYWMELGDLVCFVTGL